MLLLVKQAKAMGLKIDICGFCYPAKARCVLMVVPLAYNIHQEVNTFSSGKRGKQGKGAYETPSIWAIVCGLHAVSGCCV